MKYYLSFRHPILIAGLILISAKSVRNIGFIRLSSFADIWIFPILRHFPFWVKNQNGHISALYLFLVARWLCPINIYGMGENLCEIWKRGGKGREGEGVDLNQYCS